MGDSTAKFLPVSLLCLLPFFNHIYLNALNFKHLFLKLHEKASIQAQCKIITLNN